jgi:hypothetical protein
VAERDPDWVPIVGGGTGPYLNDPDGVNGPESEADAAVETGDAIIEAVALTVITGLGAPISTIVKEQAKNQVKQEIKRRGGEAFANKYGRQKHDELKARVQQ